MQIGFIGLGNVGAKLAGSLVRNGFAPYLHDLDKTKAQDFIANGAKWAINPKEMAEHCDVVITCLPSPAASAAVIEEENGLIEGFSKGNIWLEMSTTDEAEVKRISKKLNAIGVNTMDCPVSGGCHRAATGNISIFAGGNRETFDTVFPILKRLGRRVLHTGELGSASILKVMTNYLATANLLTVCEALVTMKGAGLDLATTFEAIKISSGNSFVHETESQVILNGSRCVDFTMDLVLKDIGLFQEIAERAKINLEISPLLIKLMQDGQARYGARAQSDRMIERFEEQTGLSTIGEDGKNRLAFPSSPMVFLQN